MTRLKFGMAACLSAKPIGKKKIVKKMAQIKEKFNYKHKRRKMGTKYVKGKKG